MSTQTSQLFAHTRHIAKPRPYCSTSNSAASRGFSQTLRHLGWLTLAVLFLISSGCATYAPTRMIAKDGPKAGRQWFARSVERQDHPTFSCSFIEFDERGDYLDFAQHEDALDRLEMLTPLDGKAPAGSPNPNNLPVILVIYCHGWKNNSQSDDVVKFNDFLERLGKSLTTGTQQYYVHGVYLAWRGGAFSSYLNDQAGEFKRMESAFSDRTQRSESNQIVDKTHSPGLLTSWMIKAVEWATFYTRKTQAEAKVSGVPMARTAFTLAAVAKRRAPHAQTFLIGHSFGALMLEKSFGQASVGLIAGKIGEDKPGSKTADLAPNQLPLNPLPFDCVLFVNSAAPSIYAKELSDLLWAYRERIKKTNPAAPAVPVIVSVTSEGDWATKDFSPLGTILLSPWETLTLQRDYTRALLWNPNSGKKPDYTAEHAPVTQRYFYLHTPGHNPLLVDHWVVPLDKREFDTVKNAWPAVNDKEAPLVTPEDVMAKNLGAGPVPSVAGDFVFYTKLRTTDKPDAKPSDLKGWKLINREAAKSDAATLGEPANKPAKDILAWSKYDSVPNTEPFPRDSVYWIIRCNKSLIKDHGDIWSDNAMEFYLALYGYIRKERENAEKILTSTGS